MASQPQKSLTTRRPFAVWLALAILIFYIPFSLLMLFLPSESVLDQIDLTEDLIGLAEVAAAYISLVVAVWALAIRKHWGRWFVAIPIAYLIGTLLWGHFVFVDEDPEDKMNILLGASVGLLPLVIVVLLVSFGEGVKKYFAERPKETSGDRTSGGLPR
jgi:hypothetical protein